MLKLVNLAESNCDTVLCDVGEVPARWSSRDHATSEGVARWNVTGDCRQPGSHSNFLSPHYTYVLCMWCASVMCDQWLSKCFQDMVLNIIHLSPLYKSKYQSTISFINRRNFRTNGYTYNWILNYIVFKNLSKLTPNIDLYFIWSF